MPTAEIIAIGTELLLGEIQDTNTRFLARLMRDAGIDLFRTHIIGDNPDRIAQAIRESLTRCQIVVTTGGLGPTIDDPTRLAVAQAMGVDLKFHPELWEQIEDRFRRFGRVPTENNRRQAFIPCNALPVENPVGTAPAFIYELEEKAVISLPGVPREMEHLMQNTVMPYLRSRYNLQGTIKACILHTAGVGESQIDEWIADLEMLSNPTVGLAAHPGIIDVRITVKASSVAEADTVIQKYLPILQARLGEHIYGKDEDTLESVIKAKLAAHGIKLTILELNPDTQVINRLKQINPLSIQGTQYEEAGSLEKIQEMIGEVQITPSEAAFAFALISGPVLQTLHVVGKSTQMNRSITRTYGGPPGHGPIWATNTVLDFIRRNI